MKKVVKNIWFFLLPAVAVGIAFGVAIHYIYAPKPIKEYSTLKEITAYAKALPEQPSSDDNNWLDPHFIQFGHSRLPSWPRRFAQFLGIGQPDPWSPRFLANQLIKLSENRKKLGLENGSRKVLHLKVHQPTSIYIFGDVHGAFHSMLRDLNHLQENNVINNDLKIINPDAYFIFNGDYINRSPYSVDALILLSILLEQNPTQVIYLPGNHERKGHWEDYGLKRELIIRGRDLSTQEIPFKEQLLTFFKTLPESLYISGKNDVNNAIRIAFNQSDDLTYREEDIPVEILSQKESLKVLKVDRHKASHNPIDVIASFQTEDWRKQNRIKNGLGFLDQDHGSSAWAVLSSPIYVHKEFLDFHSDAFAELQVGERVENASVTLHHQDTRTMMGFQIEKPLNIVSGQVSSQKKALGAKNVIKLASTMSLERGVPTLGQMAKLGLNAAINQSNRLGGDSQIMYRLYVDNDNYVPRMAKSNINEFLEHKINYVLLPIGTPTILSYIDILPKDDMLILFPITGAAAIRDKKYSNLALYHVSMVDEARILVKSIRNDYAAIKYAFLYQDDGFGRPPFNAAVEELAKLGITNYIALPYTRGSTNFDSQVKEFLKGQPDAIGFFSTAKAAQEFIRQVGASVIVNTKLFGISFAGELSIKRFAKLRGLDILFGATVPNPNTSKLPIVQDYRRALKEVNSNYDVYSLEAYIGARLFLEAVEAIEGPINPRRVMAQLESYKNYDFHGLKVNFNQSTRSMNEHMWLETKPDVEWQRISVLSGEPE